MYATKLKACLVGLFFVAGSLALSLPAAAGPEDDIDIGDDGQNLTGNTGVQMDTLNNGRPTSGGSPAPSCTWRDDDGEERDDGQMRWRLTAASQEFWGETEGEDIEKGTFYRYDCWHPEMACNDESGNGGDGCFNRTDGDDDTFCGYYICFFNAISPEHLALYAVDSFVENLPAPQPRFNPPGGTTYVNFDTWMWVENVPAGGTISAPVMQVPGITVHTTATLDSVEWIMGDGGRESCPLTVDEATAAAECNYSYTRSSASQPNATYTGTASMVWRAEWTVEEFPVSGEIEAPRSTEFDLQVAEVQTVVTR